MSMTRVRETLWPCAAASVRVEDTRGRHQRIGFEGMLCASMVISRKSIEGSGVVDVVSSFNDKDILTFRGFLGNTCSVAWLLRCF